MKKHLFFQFIFPNMTTNYNSKKIGDIYIDSNFTSDGLIKIDTNYNYSYDETDNFSHIYKFYNNYQKFKEIKLSHNIISNVVNDKFDIRGVNSTKINLLIYLVNNNRNNKSIDLFDYNTVQVIYNDNIDTLKSDINKSDISSNLGKIDTNKSDISSNLEIINTNISDISSNLVMINTNKRNISSNLGKIDTNKNDISSNLGKIDTNKSNISSNLEKMKELNQNEIYLKNISNDILYNEDTQINFSNDQPFFEKEYNISF